MAGRDNQSRRIVPVEKPAGMGTQPLSRSQDKGDAYEPGRTPQIVLQLNAQEKMVEVLKQVLNSLGEQLRAVCSPSDQEPPSGFGETSELVPTCEVAARIQGVTDTIRLLVDQTNDLLQRVEV